MTTFRLDRLNKAIYKEDGTVIKPCGLLLWNATADEFDRIRRGEYIPNIVGRDFSVVREFFEKEANINSTIIIHYNPDNDPENKIYLDNHMNDYIDTPVGKKYLIPDFTTNTTVRYTLSNQGSLR